MFGTPTVPCPLSVPYSLWSGPYLVPCPCVLVSTGPSFGTPTSCIFICSALIHVCYQCKYIPPGRYWYEPQPIPSKSLDPLEHIQVLQVLEACPGLSRAPVRDTRPTSMRIGNFCAVRVRYDKNKSCLLGSIRYPGTRVHHPKHETRKQPRISNFPTLRI